VKSGVRLNVGAGTSTADGWLNLEASPTLLLVRALPRPVLTALAPLLPEPRRAALREYASAASRLRYGDARRRLPFADGTVEAIYSSHFLEHVRREDALAFLRECHRVLRPGGVVRLVVPDLRRLARLYLEGQGGVRLTADQFLETTLLSSASRPGFLQRCLMALLDRADHLWLYDADSLTAALRKAGFSRPAERAYRESLLPDVEHLDLPERAAESVYAEAVR
jgi:SAM-dependent methyltransferase